MEPEDEQTKKTAGDSAVEATRTDAPASPEVPSAPPTLAAYFADPKLSASAFIKSLKAAKITRFEAADETQALKAIATDGAKVDKLWALLSFPALPKCIDRWIWVAVQDQLKVVAGGELDLQADSTAQIFRELRSALVAKLGDADGDTAKRARIWLQIGICWLIEKRSLDPWIVADTLKPIMFKESSAAASAARKAIQRGKWSDLRLAVGVASLANSIVEDAQRERDSERAGAVDLRFKLAESEKEIARLRGELFTAQSAFDRKNEELAAVASNLEAEKHHRGHELSETKSEQRVLLKKKIAPLLADAVDALEIEPPEPRIALGRLKRVVSIIDEV
jgi:hypothetical protein